MPLNAPLLQGSDATSMLELSSIEGIEDPFSFTPENNFGAGGEARWLAEIAEGDSDPIELGQEEVYRYARLLAERDRPVRIVDLGPGALVHLATAFNGYPARLIRVGPAYRREQPAEVDRGKQPAFSEADLEDYGDLARLEEALAADAPTLFILAGIIEHLVDPRPVLRFLRRALRRHPSNRLVLSTPDRIRIDGRDAERAPEHPARFREWTLNELGLALQGAGFEVRAIGWIPQGGWVPQDRRNGLERTVLAQLSCDEASYRAFLARNGLPAQSDHLVLTTEHADALSAGGIGRYHRHVDRVLESPRLLLFVGASGLPEGWRSFVRQRGWLHVAELCGRGSAGLSGIVTVDAQEVLSAVTHLVFLYDGMRLVEYQDYLGIGHRIAQAKRARLLPPTVTVLAYAHGTHFCLDHARGALSHERDVEVDARERLSLELADCVWFLSESLERLYVEQQGLRLRRHELRSSPEITDPEASRGYREALTFLKRGNPPPAAAPRGQVSVIVPNLNGEARFFRDLRLGLENSSYKPAEVFFVDDGSDERGLAVIEEAAASLTSLPCTVIRNAQNLGLAGARNAGLGKVVTPYVCAHDNDDIILNRYLECACRILDENPEVAAVTSWYLPFEDGGGWNTYRTQGRVFRAIGADLGFGLRENVFGGSLGVFRTEVLRRIGGWDASSKGLWEDWQLYLRLVTLGEEVWVIPREMFVYRQRKNSMLRTYPHFSGQLRLARALRPLPLAHAISLVRAMQTPTREHAGKTSRLERDRIRLMDKVARLESEVSRLRRIQGSPLWRASYPLRFLLGRLPASVRRRGRAGLKAIWLFVAPRVVRFAPGKASGTAGGGVATRQNAPPCGDPKSEDPVKVRTVRHAHPNSLILDFARATPQVFVAGMGRSGTTWVADLINHDGRHRVLFEPFFSKRVKEATGFEYLQYLPPRSDNAALAAAAKAILSGSLRNPWVDRENKRVIHFRRLIKDVRCNLMLKWLSGIAPRMRVVLVVRNPFSVVNSWLRLGWGNVPGSEQTDIDVILAQPALRAAFPLIDEVCATIDYDDPFRRLILEWCILHYVPFRQFHPGELYVVHYERLLLRFDDEIERLFRFLNSSPAHGVHHYDNQNQNGSSSNWLKRDFAGDKRSLISEWKLTFSEEQVKKASEILAAFSLDNIYDGDGLPMMRLLPDGT